MTHRLCPIYSHDLATLLPRTVVDKMRQVSRFFEGALMSGGLLRAKFTYFQLCSFGCGTYDVHGFNTEVIGEKTLWNELPKFSDCCRDRIEPFAKLIAGQLFLTNLSKTNHIIVEFGVSTEATAVSKDVSLDIANCLTKATAHALLHMLSHIDGSAFDSLELSVGWEGQERPVINSKLIDALSSICGRKFRLHADELSDTSDDHNLAQPYIGVGRMVLLNASTIADFHTLTAAFDCLETPVGRDAKLEEMHLLLTSSFACGNQLLVRTGETLDFLDNIIEFFQTTPDFDRNNRVAQIELTFEGNVMPSASGALTRLCPDEKAFRHEGLPTGELCTAEELTTFHHRFVNEPSGRDFIVMLTVRNIWHSSNYQIDQNGEWVLAGTLKRSIHEVEIELH